jgi:hypothetical protein
MRVALIMSAMIELGAGFSLLCFPSTSVMILLGVLVEAPASLIEARICGAALTTLGIACWFARHDNQSSAARGLIAAMLLYDVAVATVLSFAWIVHGLQGVALWLAVVLHSAMAVWCIAALRGRSSCP